jgi:cytochrome c oxidase assembly protein Cox11
VGLSAATAKTVLCVLCPAQFGIDLVGYEIGFDGVTASAVPVLVEICSSTAATNSTPGHEQHHGTVNQVSGRAITAGFTGFYNSTSEPTVLTPIDRFSLTPNGGTIVRDYQAPNTPDTAVSSGFVVRCTAPAVVNVNATLWFERC